MKYRFEITKKYTILYIMVISTVTKHIEFKEKDTMWKKPEIKEIAVGLEINCYACAEI